MIKAAFFDIDGTLLSHASHSVPQSARDGLEALRAKGIRCVVATGRQKEALDALPVADIPFDAYLLLNGQMILDAEKRLVDSVPMEGPARDYLLQCFRKREIPVLIVQETGMYVNFLNDHVRQAHQRISSEVPPVGEYEGGDIYQICIYITEADEWKLEDLREACLVTRWNQDGLDIVARGGGKEKGIEKYLKAMDLKPEEIIAFGDAENDVGMLKLAGIGVAMGNAGEAARAAADYITADIDDDGVAKALRHFGLIE